MWKISIVIIASLLGSCKPCFALPPYKIICSSIGDRLIFFYDDWNVQFPTATAENPYTRPQAIEVQIATAIYHGGSFSTAQNLFTKSGIKQEAVNLSSQLQNLKQAQILTPNISYITEIKEIVQKLNLLNSLYATLP